MKLHWFVVGAVLLAAGTLSALDRDFRAVGDGKDAPQELAVYRRGAGYTFMVRTDGRAAKVRAYRNGKELFILESDGMVTAAGKKTAAVPVLKGKTHWGYFVPDTVSGAKVNDFVDVTVSYTGSITIGSPQRSAVRLPRKPDIPFRTSFPC